MMDVGREDEGMDLPIAAPVTLDKDINFNLTHFINVNFFWSYA